MAGFSRTDWYEKELGSVPGKPTKKGPKGGLMSEEITIDEFVRDKL